MHFQNEMAYFFPLKVGFRIIYLISILSKFQIFIQVHNNSFGFQVIKY